MTTEQIIRALASNITKVDGVPTIDLVIDRLRFLEAKYQVAEELVEAVEGPHQNPYTEAVVRAIANYREAGDFK